MQAEWPSEQQADEFKTSAQEIDGIIELITKVRSVRQEMNVPAGAKIPLMFIGGDNADMLKRHDDVLKRLARLTEITITDMPPKGAVQIVHGEGIAALPIADVIDITAEKGRLEKERTKAGKEIAGIDKKLSNKNFIDKAPAAVVEEQKSRRAAYEAELETLNAALVRLEDL